MAKVGHLSQLHEKYEEHGFRVVAISREPSATIEEKVVQQRGAKFWIGSDPNDRTYANFIEEGRTGIPRYYLIDSRGVVVGNEIPSERQLVALLEDAFVPSLDRDLHERLADAQQAWQHRAYGAAHKLAARQQKDQDPQVAADAKLVCERITALVEFKRRVLDAELEALDPIDAFTTAFLLRGRLHGLGRGHTGWLDERLRTMRKGPDVARFDKDWKEIDKGLKREMGAWHKKPQSRGFEFERARQYYDKVASRGGLAKPVLFAKQLIEDLPGRGDDDGQR